MRISFSLFSPIFFAALLLIPATHAGAQTPPIPVGQHSSTPEDIKAINQVVENFRLAIVNKDVKLLTSQLLNSTILFSSAVPPQQIRNIREKFDVHFDGIFTDGLSDFGKFLASEKGNVEELFHDVKIVQDGNMAWVNFDYEFQMEHKTQNYGIESWQLIKDVNDQWKIISVVWSVHLPAK